MLFAAASHCRVRCACRVARSDIGLMCGAILRDCVRSAELCEALLAQKAWWKLLSCASSGDFVVQSDAFATLRVMLLVHRPVVARFLADHQRAFFDAVATLLDGSYVTKRFAVPLLTSLLLEPHNYHFMVAYVVNKRRLRQVLGLLNDEHWRIQAEMFHVLKLFVANPAKPPEITALLSQHRELLLRYLSSMRTLAPNESAYLVEIVSQS